MKKLLSLVIFLILGITQIYAQNCYNCNPATKAFTIGNNTTAGGLASFAGGSSSSASGTYSFAFGNNAEAIGNYGIALGNNAKINNFENSIALGSFVTSNVANSLVFGMGASGLPLVNNKPNSIMFGVNNFPSLTIVKPTGAALGYIGMGTDDPKEMVHVKGGKLLLESTPLGATLYETQTLSSHTIQLPTSATGLHFVVIMLKTGAVLTQKMMIQR